MLVNEITPERLSGVFGSLHQLVLCGAIVVTYFTGMWLPTEDSDPEEVRASSAWRVAMSIPGFLSIIQVIALLFFFTYDSPAYYADKSNDDLVNHL